MTYKRLIYRDFVKNKYIYFMLLPVVVYYIVFHYFPMYGLQIAFKNYSLGQGITNSPWIGVQNFQQFFSSYYFGRTLRNTLLISLYDILFAFPASIILALLLNEVRNRFFKRTVQSITYFPHFISMVVVVGMMVDFLSADGLINRIIVYFGGNPISFLQDAGWFRTIYVTSGVWQGIGWGSIIYLAAIANIDPTLYEAAKVDGAGRWKQAVHITIPCILPTIAIFFILRMGGIMTVGDEKILLLYNPRTYETADVIGTYIYRKGILDANYSFSAAVGMFNSIVNFTFLVLANAISRRWGGARLW